MARRLSIRLLKGYLQTSKETSRPRRRYSREEYLGMLRSRAARGAKLLDRRAPGWWERIEVSRLDLASCPLCVMGQLFGHYEQGLARLAVWRRGHEYGFALPSFESEMSSSEAWVKLTDIWRSIVFKRRVDQLLDDTRSEPSTPKRELQEEREEPARNCEATYGLSSKDLTRRSMTLLS